MNTRMEPSYRDDIEYEIIKSITCYCMGMCPEDEEKGHCETKPGGKCFASVELDIDDEGEEVTVFSFGCLPPNEMALFQCRSSHMERKNNKSIKCCDGFDFCNKLLLPVLDSNPETHRDASSDAIHGSIIISLIIIIVGICTIFAKLRQFIAQRKLENRLLETPLEMTELGINGSVTSSSDEDSGIHEKLSVVDATRSNTRKGQISERTVIQDVTLETLITKGKHTEIWRGKWRDEKVAVKIYSERGAKYWTKEMETFQCGLLRHENIVAFIVADIQENGRMYLLTEYQPYGSLRDFLQNHTVTPTEVIQMIRGLACGLAHLHTEIIGSSFKPCFAHNNINSRSIVMSATKECCFCDFSRTARWSSSYRPTLGLTKPRNFYNSDIRYLAPEFLNHTFNPNMIESFIQGDIYSLSLVFWEILNCCVLEEELRRPVHQLPYNQQLSNEQLELKKENLIDIVVARNCRPIVRTEWEEIDLLNPVVRIMVECWSGNASARLSCLRIKKSIFKVLQQRPMTKEDVRSSSSEDT